MFWSKKKEQSEVEEINMKEHSRMYDLLKALEVSVSKVETKYERLEQYYKALRGLVNKKLKIEPLKFEDDESDENSETEKDLNDDGFQDLRNLRKTGVK